MKIGDEIWFVKKTWEDTFRDGDPVKKHTGYESASGRIISCDDSTAAILPSDANRIVFRDLTKVFDSEAAYEQSRNADLEEFPENAWKW